MDYIDKLAQDDGDIVYQSIKFNYFYVYGVAKQVAVLIPYCKDDNTNSIGRKASNTDNTLKNHSS